MRAKHGLIPVSFFEKLIRLLFPAKCMVCNTVLMEDARSYLCNTCKTDLERYGGGFRKSDGLSYIDGIFAAFRYHGGIETAIQAFKYKNHPRLSETISMLLCEELEKHGGVPEADYIIPVPMHPGKKRRRGYNQSELIAGHLGEYLNMEVRTDIIRKIRHTRPQSRLKRLDRLRNLKGAFSAVPGTNVEGKDIILVDDVLTTGTTMNTCAKILREKGAVHIYGIVVAIAEK